MAEKLMRYADSNVSPPVILYTVNKCCSLDGTLKFCGSCYTRPYCLVRNFSLCERIGTWLYFRRTSTVRTLHDSVIISNFWTWQARLPKLHRYKGKRIANERCQSSTKEAASKTITIIKWFVIYIAEGGQKVLKQLQEVGRIDSRFH